MSASQVRRSPSGRYLSDHPPACAAISQWGLWQKAQHLSPRTVEDRLMTVRRLAAFTGNDPTVASSEDVASFLAGLDVSRTAAATYHSHLRAWFRWLVTTDQRADSPMIRVPGPKVPRRRPRPVTDRELTAVLSTRMHRRTKTMILLAAYQGLRVSEIARLRGEDVNIHDRLLRIRGKGDSDIEIPLHPLIVEEAEGYPRQGWWFPSHTKPGSHILGQSVTQMISAVFERAGVCPGAHRLRHWYGTALLEGGANLRVVQELLRHSYVQTTQVYTQVSIGQQREAIDTLAVLTSSPHA